jgi:hypothetical protein
LLKRNLPLKVFGPSRARVSAAEMVNAAISGSNPFGRAIKSSISMKRARFARQSHDKCKVPMGDWAGTRRYRELHHLAHRPWINPETAGRRPLAQVLNLDRIANPSI